MQGQVRLEAREDHAGIAVEHLVAQGSLARPLTLWQNAYRATLNAYEERREMWIPLDPSRPWLRVRTRVARTVWSNAPELGAPGAAPRLAPPRETTALRCDEIATAP